MTALPLKRQSQQLSSALSSFDFKSHFCKQCGPRSDCSFRSSLIRVHTVCLYAKNGFEKFARIFSRRHKQTTFSDVGFLGVLRVNNNFLVLNVANNLLVRKCKTIVLVSATFDKNQRENFFLCFLQIPFSNVYICRLYLAS